jgi:ABC-type transporter MlaC component
MKRILMLAALAALAGCGVETAVTAGSAAQVRKQEMEQAQKTLQQAQRKIEQAQQQIQQRAESAGQ